MKTITTTTTLLAVFVAFFALTSAQDVMRLLQNRQVVDQEIRCITRSGPCDVIGRTIQRMIPEVVNNNCQRCTPQQQQQANVIVNFMKQNHPAEWEQIRQMYKRPRRSVSY